MFQIKKKYEQLLKVPHCINKIFNKRKKTLKHGNVKNLSPNELEAVYNTI